MTRAIIFDCFGVLTTDELITFHQKYFGTNPVLLAQAKALSNEVDARRATYSDMLKRLANMAALPLEATKTHIECNVANEEVFAYIQNVLKPKYKIGLLSNAGENWLDELFTPSQIGLFDAILLSCQVGYTKPDARIYTAMAQRLAMAPASCLMVDDQERYCKGAEAVGMRAVIYRGLPSLQQAVAEFGDVAN